MSNKKLILISIGSIVLSVLGVIAGYFVFLQIDNKSRQTDQFQEVKKIGDTIMLVEKGQQIRAKTCIEDNTIYVIENTAECAGLRNKQRVNTKSAYTYHLVDTCKRSTHDDIYFRFDLTGIAQKIIYCTMDGKSLEYVFRYNP